MRKIFVFFLPMFCIGIFSCQQEIPPFNIPPSSPADTTAKLLQKYVVTSGSDSTVVIYNYNSTKSVVGVEIAKTLNSVVEYQYYNYTRNAAGQIVSSRYTSATGGVSSGDTTYGTYFYSTSASPQLIRSVLRTQMPNTSIKDSTIYTYSGIGDLTNKYLYQLLGSDTSYVLDKRIDLIYDNSRKISQERSLSNFSGQLLVNDSSFFTYDDKKPVIALSQNDINIIFRDFIGERNNLTKEIYAPVTNLIVGYAYIYTISYVYTSFNQPATAKVLNVENGIIDTSYLKFTYQ